MLDRAAARYNIHAGPRETVRLSRALVRLGRFKEALAILTKARKLNPENHRVRFAYDCTVQQQLRVLYTENLRALRTSRDAGRYVKLIDVCRAMGNTKKALHFAHDAEARFPRDAYIHLSLARLYFFKFCTGSKLSDRQQCLKYLARTRVLIPRDYNASLFITVAFLRLDVAAEARKLLDTLAAAYPRDPRILRLCALAQGVPAEDMTGPAGSASAVPAPAQHPLSASQALRKLADLSRSIPGTLGVFLFAPAGNLIHSLTYPNTQLHFEDHLPYIRALSTSCRQYTQRLGIGEFGSCFVTGPTWQISVNANDGQDLIWFFDRTTPPNTVQDILQEQCLAVSFTS